MENENLTTTSADLEITNEFGRTVDKSHAVARPVCPVMEEILGWAFPVLDHGFIRIIDYLGDESAIVQGARVSYGVGTKSVSDDVALINYLIRHRHSSPVELCVIKMHVKLPIFVGRQWVRHRTQSLNEYSARYSKLCKQFYFPHPDHIAVQSTDNKQGRSMALTAEQAQVVLDMLEKDAEGCYRDYEILLNMDDDGNVIDPDKPCVARELARMNLPVNIYTEWYCSMNVRNLLHFLGLRMDHHAQYEIRVYAETIFAILARWMPNLAKAFMNYEYEAATYSKQMRAVLIRMLKGEDVTQETSGLTKREWREFQASLDLQD